MDAYDRVFLRSNVKVEPLSFRWYVWSHLLSPVSYALNLTHRYLPMMKSFISNPAIHEAASRDPLLIGGAFIDLQASEVSKVRNLLFDTMKRAAYFINLAEDLGTLDRQLQREATGFRLDDIYERLPSTLRGLVEATYDLNNHPSIRVIEQLACNEGKLNLASTQEICLSDVRDEDRKFFLNTPRMDSTGGVVVSLPFIDRRLDLIAAGRIQPISFTELAESLRIGAATRSRFREFFTTNPPLRNDPDYRGDGVRIRFFGHACALLQTSDVSVLIDPFVTWDRNSLEHRLTFDDLPDFVDCVFLTHGHQDHFSAELLLQLRNRIGRILVARNNPNCPADPSLKLALGNLGFDNVVVMDPMDTWEIPGGKIISLPFLGEHADLNIASKHGMFMELKGQRFLFLADSNCKDRELYRRIARQIGKVQNLFIGMECVGAPLSWLYGTYLSKPIMRKDDESRRLAGADSSAAWSIVEEFGCTRAYVYAMAQEPWLRFVSGLQYGPESKQLVESDRFIAQCRANGMHAERLSGCRTLEFIGQACATV
jgi:L-ascorbate metabolism protein UlaG (beta-lactamase superfamily)